MYQLRLSLGMNHFGLLKTPLIIPPDWALEAWIGIHQNGQPSPSAHPYQRSGATEDLSHQNQRIRNSSLQAMQSKVNNPLDRHYHNPKTQHSFTRMETPYLPLRRARMHRRWDLQWGRRGHNQDFYMRMARRIFNHRLRYIMLRRERVQLSLLRQG